jgi:hypothetical protein
MGAPDEFMPREQNENPVAAPYGCGAFGCAYETGDPDVTLKLTTDISEAIFSRQCILRGWSSWPGLCGVHLVASFGVRMGRSETASSPVYGVWRRAVEIMGDQSTTNVKPLRLEDLTSARENARNVGWEMSQISELLIPHSTERPIFAQIFWSIIEAIYRSWRHGSPLRLERLPVLYGLKKHQMANAVETIKRSLSEYKHNIALARRDATTTLAPVCDALLKLLNGEGVLMGDAAKHNLGRLSSKHGHEVVLVDSGVYLPMRAELALADFPVIQFQQPTFKK